MKRVWLVAAVLMVSGLCTAQMMSSHPQTNGAVDPHAGVQSPHGGAPSSRTVFGRECGINDTSPQSALGLSRSPQGWSLVTPEKPRGPNDGAVARVWRETSWMVDVHDAPGDGRTIHTGQMCFDSNGQLTRMIDRYIDLPKCNCMRYTALSLDANGGVVKQEQKFISLDKGAEMTLPEAAKGFPAVFGFRRIEQLPFYSLVKK